MGARAPRRRPRPYMHVGSYVLTEFAISSASNDGGFQRCQNDDGVSIRANDGGLTCTCMRQRMASYCSAASSANSLTRSGKISCTMRMCHNIRIGHHKLLYDALLFWVHEQRYILESCLHHRLPIRLRVATSCVDKPMACVLPYWLSNVEIKLSILLSSSPEWTIHHQAYISWYVAASVDRWNVVIPVRETIAPLQLFLQCFILIYVR